MGMRFIHGGQDVQGRILRIGCRWTGEVEQLSMVCVNHDTGINDMLGGAPTVQDVMALHDHSLVVVTKLIKGRGWLIRR